MICSACKKEIPETVKFCPFCGSKQELQPVVPVAPVVEQPVVPAMADDDKTVALMDETQYIPSKQYNEETTQPPTHTPYQFSGEYYPNATPVAQPPCVAPPQPEAKPPKKKKSAALIIVPIIFAFLIIVAIVVFGILFAVIDKNKSGDKQEYITYLTSNELYYASKEDIQNPIKIDDIEYDDETYYYVVENTVIRGDNVFYIQNVEYVNDGPVFSIYMKNIRKNSEPVKIDDDVTSGYFAVDESGEKLIYTKDTVVYYNDLENLHRIAGDVVGWCVDDEVENVMFLRDDGDIMALCTAEITEDASPETVISGITELHSISDDMTEIVCEKDDGLYIYKDGEAKHIDSNVEQIYGEENETFYYIVTSDEGVSKSVYFNDDLAISDAAVTEPDLSDYTAYYYGFTYTLPEYYDALEEYNVKLNRDKVRAMAQEPMASYDLYYYDGNSGKLVCEDVEMYDIYYDESRIVFKSYDHVAATKFNMSDLSVVEDFETYLLRARNESMTSWFASGDKIAREISLKNAANFVFAEDAVYYLDNHTYIGDSYISEGDLKKLTVSSSGEVTTSLIENDVNNCTVLDEDKTIVGYFKELNSKDCGKLYVNGEFIEDDVYAYSVTYADGKYYVIKNYNYETNKGELCVVENGETKIVSQSASGYNTRMEGYLFYSSDMRSDSHYNYTFSLNRYDGEESVLMTDDAVTWNIMPDYFLEQDKDAMIFVTGYGDYYYG